ncbi:hypothetical protein CYK74_09790 [Clostridium perfringens]|nr:hypothetical protein CYK74_09790 [Clostridium perfringens]
MKTYVINIMLRKDHKNIILNFITWKAMTLIIAFLFIPNYDFKKVVYTSISLFMIFLCIE